MSDVAPELPKPTAMLHWEQQAGYGVAGAVAIGGVLSGIVDHNTLAAALGIGAALLLAFGAYRGQRVIAAVIGMPCVVVAQYLPVELIAMGYLFLLVMRTSNARSKLRYSQPRASSAERRAATEARIAEKQAKRKGLAPPSASKKPTANRRYTPPKPKKVRPKPSAERDAEGSKKRDRPSEDSKKRSEDLKK
ncbi:MAG: hypothetical protein ACRDZ8_04905 [Acidimicrobiales bacterium]